MSGSRRSRQLPRLEALEDRTVPAVLVVNTTADTTDGDAFLTLREAITLVNAGTSEDPGNGLGRPLTAGDIASFEEHDPQRPWRVFVDVLAPQGEHEREAYGRVLNRFDDWVGALGERGIVISDVSYRERDIQAYTFV